MLTVAIPSRDGRVHVKLLNQLSGTRLILSMQPQLTMAREDLLYRAWKRHEDVLMLDDDVIPEVDIKVAYQKALQYFEQGYDAVCGYYWLKNMGGESVGVLKENALKYLLPTSMEGDVVWFPAPPTMPMEVDVCGLGFVFLRKEFVDKVMKDSGRHFDFVVIDRDRPIYMGEDVYFFLKYRPRAIVDPEFKALHLVTNAWAYDVRGTLVNIRDYLANDF